MDIKFEQSVLRYLSPVAEEVKTCEETQQVRLADTLPDIKQVVAGWGQVIIRGKQWLADQIQSSGGVKVWTLYKSEDDSYQCVEAWVPFQLAWEISPQLRDGCVTIRPYLRNIDVRALSDRKIMVRVTVGVHACAVVLNEKEIYYSENLPEDVENLINTYPVNLPVECGEKMFNTEEPCQLPADSCVIRCTAMPSILENKIVADKLVMRGVMKIDMLNLCADGTILKTQHEYPFSQFAQLDKEYEKHSMADIVPVVTELDVEKNDAGEQMLHCSILAQYTIYEIKNVSVVEDAYSNKRNMEVHSQELELPSLLNYYTQTLHATADVSPEVNQVLDISCSIDELNIVRDGDVLVYSPTGVFQLLCTDVEENIVSVQRKWFADFRSEHSGMTDVYATVKIDDIPQNMGTHLSQNLILEIKSISNAKIPMVSQLQIGEEKAHDGNRESVIVCKMGDERLWDLAKNTGSSVSAIKQANKLSEEPEVGQILLIPVN